MKEKESRRRERGGGEGREERGEGRGGEEGSGGQGGERGKEMVRNIFKKKSKKKTY